MADPRTEQEAESGLLTVRMGGEPFRLPVLSIALSEDWQTALARTLADLEIGTDSEDGAEVIAELFQQGQHARLAALGSYDHFGHLSKPPEDAHPERCEDCVLGGAENIRRHMTQRELGEAVEVILDAEFPFDTTGRRSVEEAFGLPLRVLGLAAQEMAESISARAKSASGRLPIGASTSPASAESGPKSNSRSAGPTASGGSRRKAKRG